MIYYGVIFAVKVRMILVINKFFFKHPPTPLQRGRCDGQYTRALGWGVLYFGYRLLILR